MIWGGDKLRQYKAIDTDQKNIGESWELSGVPGNESVVSNGSELDLKQGETVLLPASVESFALSPTTGMKLMTCYI